MSDIPRQSSTSPLLAVKCQRARSQVAHQSIHDVPDLAIIWLSGLCLQHPPLGHHLRIRTGTQADSHGIAAISSIMRIVIVYLDYCIVLELCI